MTYAEYLALEEASTEKHEFINGEAYALSGGTPVHALLQAQVMLWLGTALRGRPCWPYGPDLRIQFPDLDESAYADGVVICGPVVVSGADPGRHQPHRRLRGALLEHRGVRSRP